MSSGAVLFVYLFPKDKLLDILTTEVAKSLKRKISVTDIEYSFRGVLLKNVILFDGITEEDPVLAAASGTSVRFSLYSLFYRRLSISDISIDNLKINIVYTNGQSNIELFLNDIKSIGESRLTTEISKIGLHNASITLTEAPETLKPLSGSYLFNGTLNLSQKGLISIPDAKVMLPEKRGIVKADIAVSTEKLEITGDARLEKCSIPWTYRWGTNVQLPFLSFAGDVKKLIITKRVVKGQISGRSQLRGGKTLTANGFCKVDIPGEMVYLSNITGSIQSSKLIMKEILISSNGDIARFHISTMDVHLTEITPYLPVVPKNTFGNVSGNLKYVNNRYSGVLELKGAGYNREKKLISDVNCSLDIKNGVFKKENIEASVFQQPFRLSIASTDGAFNRFYINLNAKRFTMKPKEGSASADLPETIPLAESTPLVVTGNIIIEEFLFDAIPVKKLKVNYSFNDNQLAVNRFDCNLWGGSVTGRGQVELSRKSPNVQFSIQFNGIKVQDIGALNERLKNRAFGNASGRAEGSFSLGDDFNIYKSMKGSMEFSIDRGKLVNTGLQHGLSIWLSELRYKLKDIEFNKIYGNFKISGNTYLINSFIFNAPDIQLKLDGYITYDDKQLTGDLPIILLMFNDTFIKDIPNPARLGLQNRKKGRWYEIPFKQKGDITDPKSFTML